MFTRKNLERHLIALALPAILIFGYTCWYNSYLFNHSKAAYLAYQAKRWDNGLNTRLTWRIPYSASALRGSYRRVIRARLLALGGRLKGED